MRAAAKSQVLQRLTIRIEDVGSVELGGIALSRGQQRHQHVKSWLRARRSA
jgi:hypothetical protein